MARSPPIAILHGQGLRRDDLWTPMVRTGQCRNHAHADRRRLPVTTTAYRTTGPLITKPWPRARAASSLRTARRHHSAKGPVSLVAFTKHSVRTRPCCDGAIPGEDEGGGARTSDWPGLKMLRASRVPPRFHSTDSWRHGRSRFGLRRSLHTAPRTLLGSRRSRHAAKNPIRCPR